jgi:hypothetical protein
MEERRAAQRRHHFPRRPSRVNIRLSEEEATAIEEAAAKEGMSKSAFVVASALRQAEMEPELPRRAAPDGQVLRALLQQVNALYSEAARQGSNLNQMAHVLNAGHDLPAGDVTAMAKRSADVLAELGPLVERLRTEFGYRLT